MLMQLTTGCTTTLNSSGPVLAAPPASFAADLLLVAATSLSLVEEEWADLEMATGCPKSTGEKPSESLTTNAEFISTRMKIFTTPQPG